MTTPSPISAQAAEQINTELRALEETGRTALDHVVAVGQMLLQVKDQLHRGEFKPWVETHVSCSYRQAAKYMRIAKSESRFTFDPAASLASALRQIAPPKPENVAATSNPCPSDGSSHDDHRLSEMVSTL